MATPTTSRSPLMSKVVDDFLDLAKQYRKAYYDLPEPMPSWPKYFLFCHSIELVLKAYLAHHGLTEKQLQNSPFGHNIKNLLDQAIKRGLSLSANTRASIGLLTEAHKKYWPRYPMKKANSVILIYQCETDADVAAIKRGKKIDDFLIDKSAGKGRKKRRWKR